jgi:hypothetical protein
MLFSQIIIGGDVSGVCASKMAGMPEPKLWSTGKNTS